MSKRIYISGPISGMTDENRPAFARAEAAIIASGHMAVNPHHLPHNHDLKWSSYMREAIVALMACDEVHALPGCGMSQGANIELLIASAIGMPIRYAGSVCDAAPSAGYPGDEKWKDQGQ